MSEQGGPIAASGAQVIAILPTEGRTFKVAGAVTPVPITTAKSVWRVFEFSIDGAGNFSSIIPLNTVVSDTPTAYQP